jgi:hypothetical protein
MRPPSSRAASPEDPRSSSCPQAGDLRQSVATLRSNEPLLLAAAPGRRDRFRLDRRWKRVRVARALMVAALSAAVFAVAGSAAASLNVATNVQRPGLRVDARGWAEVSWTAAGARRYLLIPPAGRVLPGGRVRGRDVSRVTTSVRIPFRTVVRRTPAGRYWALQAWRVRPAGPVELRFSRWRGRPTKLALEAVEPRANGYVVRGRATFAGRPIPLWSATPEGKRLRSYAYIDRMTATGWRRVGGVAVRADGTFARYVAAAADRPRFRAVLPGPNLKAAWAPDAVSPALAAPTY